jgi:Leucine-rich repeat (LRR) protein
MPPKGKIQITENELIILKWWIEQGASFDKKVSQLAVNNEVKPILASLGIGEKINILSEIKQDKYTLEENILAKNVDAIDKNAIEKVKKSGGLILPLSQNNNYVEVTFLNNPKFSDKDASIIGIAPVQTLWLKLSKTQITDNSIEFIMKLPNLTRLHLENTKITDNAINSIIVLQNLEYLNLIETNISDASVQNLSKLKNLKKLYLWKTKVTLSGVETLKKALPNLVVDLGITKKQMTEFEKVKANEVSDDVYKKK